LINGLPQHQFISGVASSLFPSAVVFYVSLQIEMGMVHRRVFCKVILLQLLKSPVTLLIYLCVDVLICYFVLEGALFFALCFIWLAINTPVAAVDGSREVGQLLQQIS
jgi:hypothetical protein